MNKLIANIAAADRVIDKLDAAPNISDMSLATQGRLPYSMSIDAGHVAVSVDRDNIVRFYDRFVGGGTLVHEETMTARRKTWLDNLLTKAAR